MAFLVNIVFINFWFSNTLFLRAGAALRPKEVDNAQKTVYNKEKF